MTDEAGQALPRLRSPRCSTTRSARTGTTAPSARTSTRTTRPQPANEAIVAAAQTRGVPLISYKQLLDWVDGRNGSTIRGLSWNAGTLHVHHDAGAGAGGLQTLLPIQGPAEPSRLIAAARPSPTPYETIKGIQYARFTQPAEPAGDIS